MYIMEAVGRRIKQIMQERGVSIYYLSRKSGLSPKCIQDLAKGKNKDANMMSILKLLKAFALTLSEFFNANDINNSEL